MVEAGAAPASGEILRMLRREGVLSALDWHFARQLTEIYCETSDEVRLLAALTSHALAQGHVCLDLRDVAASCKIAGEGGGVSSLVMPTLEEWHGAIVGTSLIGERDDATPLVIDHNRIYTRRYWRYEANVAEEIRRRSGLMQPSLSAEEIRTWLERLYAPSDAVDWQRVAAVVALHSGLSVVSGGPGTGKTYTAAKVVVLLAEDHRKRCGELPRVSFMAPTGKAANRLGQSMRRAADELDCDEEIRELIRSRPTTIHRALGRRPRTRTHFRHNAENPLRSDLVVLDEASMVDMGLMSRLLRALPHLARIVVLGDRDQLSSVEAGAILADICGGVDEHGYSQQAVERIDALSGDAVPAGGVRGGVCSAVGSELADTIVVLKRNYRYGDDSGIGRMAAAINRGLGGEVLRLARDPEVPDVTLHQPVGDGIAELLRLSSDKLAGLFSSDTEQRLAALVRFRVLCAFRQGTFGVREINRQIEMWLRREGRIDIDGEVYPGRPIMVTQNDAETDLFNGDVGVLCESDKGIRAKFPDTNHPRTWSLGRIPPFESVYATTIHKSQGSEFEEVAIVLANESSPLLTRELLYTAVTRARRRVRIFASPAVVVAACARRVGRASGLRERLWPGVQS